MRRKYKLILIIFCSIIITYFIYIFYKEDKIYLVSLGDGISSGETSYNIDGISYNDYLREYYEEKNILKNYNFNFSKKNYTLTELINDIENNVLDDKTNLYIKQELHKANIITISIGMDELSKLEMTNDLDIEYLKKFINNYDKLINMLKEITNAKLLIIGYYENMFLNKSNVIMLNSEISNISLKYNETFINISDLMMNKDYFLNNKSYYFSYKGHEIIKEIIINSI